MSQPAVSEETQRAFLDRAYALSSIDETRALYDEWAATYDKDLADPSHDWVAPAFAAAALLRFFQGDEPKFTGENLEVLDAGCGTGIVGAALAQQATAEKRALQIDGIDLSTGMLNVARNTGVYRSLDTADMSRALAIEDRRYHAVICVGVLTKGHVGPEVLPEFVRLVKPGGCVVATVREDVWETAGYLKTIEDLERAGQVKVISADSHNSLRGASITMRLPILLRL